MCMKIVSKHHNRISMCLIIMLMTLISVLLIGCSQDLSSQIENVQKLDCKFEASPEIMVESYSCSHKGVNHNFTVFYTDKIQKLTPVLMLHGYGSDADSFARDTEFYRTAVPQGFAVIYVTGAPAKDVKTSATCFNGGSAIGGNDDVGFLCALVQYLRNNYDLSKDRCAAVGFSNGAFMVHRLITEGKDIFTDCVSVAGIIQPYAWETRPEKVDANVLQVTGKKDDVVPQERNGSDKYSISPAIEKVMCYYAGTSEPAEILDKDNPGSFGESNNKEGYGSLGESNNNKEGYHSIAEDNINEVSYDSIGEGTIKKSAISDAVHNGKIKVINYTEQSERHVVREIVINDGRHSWYDEKYCGFNLNQTILEFLSR